MTSSRAAILTTTLIAWAVPTAVALWLDVERFVHPSCEPTEEYARTASFQTISFVFRFGWWLLLVLAVVGAVQVGLMRRRNQPSHRP